MLASKLMCVLDDTAEDEGVVLKFHWLFRTSVCDYPSDRGTDERQYSHFILKWQEWENMLNQ